MQSHFNGTTDSACRSEVNENSRRILIVDDEENLRVSMALLLEHSGYEVETVPDGRSALRSIARCPVALVITDIYMPEHDGLELILALRARTARPRIIAMTGSANYYLPDALRMAHSLGADRELSKPFEPEVLLQLISEMVSNPERTYCLLRPEPFYPNDSDGSPLPCGRYPSRCTSAKHATPRNKSGRRCPP